MEAFQEKTEKSVVITGGAPKEGDNSATPEVQQTAGTSITEYKVNGRHTTYTWIRKSEILY